MSRGLLIAFEGIDGAGKTTQLKRLEAHLEIAGFEVVCTKEPTTGTHGQALRASAHTGRLPATEELELFVADRREHVRDVIVPALERGAAVLVDRYYFSTAAYQGARGLDPREILARNETFAPVPDAVLWFDIDPAAGVARVRGRDGKENLFEDLAALTKCREIFASLDHPAIMRIDASATIEAIEREVVRVVICGVLAGVYELTDVWQTRGTDPAWNRSALAAVREARRSS